MKKLLSVFTFLSFFTCEIVNIDYLTPIVGTQEPSSVLTNSVIMGGAVLGEGGKDVQEFGIVWSETFPPTVEDNKTIEGSRIGSFSKRYEGLKSNTTYYCSAYGISEVGVGYGKVYEFTTNSEPSCSPAIDNRIDTGNNVNGILSINSVVLNSRSLGFNDGNVEFQTRIGNSTLVTFLNFNEINGSLPLTGEYLTVGSFDNQSIRSNREVILRITDFGIGGLGGGRASEGKKVYVENNSNTITFIFCDVEVNSNYNLNGKFTYTP
ncbi:hypothetical protein [Hyunsoonleella ulvae]|uniref:hypothetical protein n=1 Tax=Hyunsoonleella ulvae TaxID=2799948 RepID=UPI0019398E29|nr:hypothetical protein [Hyunsoonleella ulvae]